ncbi:hypothetical protein V8C42DRAFT_161068 [Trichoderma barbatum]
MLSPSSTHGDRWNHVGGWLSRRSTGTQCVASLVNGESGHGTWDFSVRDRRGEWRRVFVRYRLLTDLVWRSLLNDGRFCCLFSPPPVLPNCPVSVPLFLIFDTTTYLVYIWSRFWRIAMEMLSPNDVCCFSHFACFSSFPPSTPLHSGFVSYVGLVVRAPQREEKGNCVFPPAPSRFLQQQPLEKMAKRNSNPIKLRLFICRCRCDMTCLNNFGVLPSLLQQLCQLGPCFRA